MKLLNMASLDPKLKKRGITGLSNCSKLDKLIFEEFSNDWENLSFESEKLLFEYQNRDTLESFETSYQIESLNLNNLPIGMTKTQEIKGSW